MRIKRPQFTPTQPTQETFLLSEVDLIPPTTLEQAIHLLGFQQAKVEFFSPTNKNVMGNYYLNPTKKGVYWTGGELGTGINYPEWMSRYRMLVVDRKRTLILNNSNKGFLRMYPHFYLQLTPNSLEIMVLNRFKRMVNSSDFNDAILESMIILESLVTEERKEIGFQLRIKVSWLIANNIEDRKTIGSILKHLYDIRSEIVHNGGVNVRRIAEKQLGGLPQATFFAKELARLVILRIIFLKENTLQILSHSELNKKLKNLMYGSQLKITNSIYFDEAGAKVLEDIMKRYSNLKEK